MAEQTLTHKDLAKALNVSETTIKSYRRKFADCIPVASKGKPIRFTADALPVALRIRDMFEAGMSVAEARARLAQEFSWIALVASKPEPVGRPVALPPEFTLSLSNLAKSMVTLTRQQSAIIDRIRVLESALKGAAAGGVGLFADAASASAAPDSLAESLREFLRQELAPLRCLDEVRELVAALRQAGDKMSLAAQALRDVAAWPASILGQAGFIQTGAGASACGAESEQSPALSRVIPFHAHGAAGATAVAGAAFAGQSGPAEVGPASAQQDPPRDFLLIPLVARTAGGTYISAGGKSGGRFTLSDLKALLAYGRRPPEHYTLHWEQIAASATGAGTSSPGAGGQWRLTLDQPQAENPRPLRLLIKEEISQRGAKVAEIVQLFDSDQVLHPAEFCAFVAGLSG